MFKRFANLQTESSIVRGISMLLMVILIYGLAILPSSANRPVNAATITFATKAAPFAPTARFEDGWVEHNVTQNGRKGMRVHTRFKVFSGYGYECLIVAYFYYDNGKVLKAKTNRYSTTDGQVSVNVPFKPAYDPAVYDNFQLFMPYDELNLTPNYKYDLKFVMKLYNKSAKSFFAVSESYPFVVTF